MIVTVVIDAVEDIKRSFLSQSFLLLGFICEPRLQEKGDLCRCFGHYATHVVCHPHFKLCDDTEEIRFHELIDICHEDIVEVLSWRTGGRE